MPTRAQWQTERRLKANLSLRREATSGAVTKSTMSVSVDSDMDNSFDSSESINETPGAFAITRGGDDFQDSAAQNSISWEMGSNDSGDSDDEENDLYGHHPENIADTTMRLQPLDQENRRQYEQPARSRRRNMNDVDYEQQSLRIDNNFNHPVLEAMCSFDETTTMGGLSSGMFSGMFSERDYCSESVIRRRSLAFDAVIEERQNKIAQIRRVFFVVVAVLLFAACFVIGLKLFSSSSSVSKNDASTSDATGTLFCGTHPLATFNTTVSRFNQEEGMINPILQCSCGSSVDITNITANVRERYKALKTMLPPQPYGGDDLWHPLRSCSTINLSILWLAWFHQNITSITRMRNQYVLVQLYIDWQGSDWTKSDNWLTQENECLWHGVECDDGLENITALNLNENNVNGEIHSFPLSLLPQLEDLDVRFNALSGSIPILQHLTRLNIGTNRLKTIIPTEISMLSVLQGLYLNHNDINGTLPTEFSALSQLRELDIGNTKLQGNISQSILHLTHLKAINMANTPMSGSFPSFLSLANMTHLHVSFSLITGTLPGALGRKLSKLELFRVANTNVEGTIPESIGELPNLKLFDIGSTSIKGTIPTQIGYLTNLTLFDVSQADISGTVPTEIGLLSNLKEFNAATNSLTGTVPSEVTLLTNLKKFQIQRNQIGGSIPPELCDGAEVLRPCTVSCACCIPSDCCRDDVCR